MPKGFELCARHANGVPYHRQNKQRKFNTRKYKDHVRGTHSFGSDYISDPQSFSCPDTRVLPAHGKSSQLADHRKAALASTLVRGPGRAASGAVEGATHETGTPESVIQDIYVTISPI